jgi:hypothetical protein
MLADFFSYVLVDLPAVCIQSAVVLCIKIWLKCQCSGFAILELAPWLDPWVQTMNEKLFGGVFKTGNVLVRLGSSKSFLVWCGLVFPCVAPWRGLDLGWISPHSQLDSTL